jgi:hypothetical protein
LLQREAYGGYYYLGPLDNPCCGPPAGINIARAWADTPNPYDEPTNTGVNNSRRSWPKFMEEAPKRIEVFTKRIAYTEEALEHFGAAQPVVAPGSTICSM